MTIWEVYSDHQIGQELRAISDRLDRHPNIRIWASEDLLQRDTKETGRNGLTVDSIIRAGILKQMKSFTYEDLAFFIDDSKSSRAFTRITGQSPGSSSLQSGISQISAGTWEKISRALVQGASKEGLEHGRVTRTDATVMETNIHAPTDSSLLNDGVRTITRILKNEIKDHPFQDHTRAAKKYDRHIQYMRKGAKQTNTYRKLVRVARKAHKYLCLAVAGQPKSRWAPKAERVLQLMARVIDQTWRRVILGETVPAGEKVFSIFEDHTDIIKKGGRKTQFGHKLNLTTGKTGLVIDMVVEDGNPADSNTAVRMVKRQIDIYGRPPRQTCFDGCYTSKLNLTDVKKLGVKDAAFHKKRGLTQKEMTSSKWVYRKLLNFRAGIEGNISTLKRGYGWYRCSWKGRDHFNAYAWLSVVAYNLVTLSRLE